MAYTHLSDEQRCDIYELKANGYGVREIATRLGRDKSTISRELRRNRGERGYRPSQAHRAARERLRMRRAGKTVAKETVEAVMGFICRDYSPEQSAGRCKALGLGRVSHETLYKLVYADKAAGGSLWKHLRCAKKRRKHYGSGRTKRGRIPNRIGLEERCPRVEDRATIGLWEGDLVIGKNHKHVIITLVERRSGLSVIRRVRSTNAQGVATGIIAALKPYPALVRTITFDNGLEFAQHEMIVAALGVKIYFASPYSSWQRGTNEKFNGLLRQYFPKGSCFLSITDAQLAAAQARIDHRARKRIAWATPHEVFMASAKRAGVALAG